LVKHNNNKNKNNKKKKGTRFNIRGIDENGNVVNFVETEQILETDDNFYSILLIRFFILLKKEVLYQVILKF
jgi:hypothetical protein